jgi:drug/metabolite transporter (DMT)-like permease
MRKAGAWLALAGALLFGASTPFAKLFLRDTSPVALAGLLYLGSGVGLLIVSAGRIRGMIDSFRKLPVREVAPLIGAIVLGGVTAPVLLMTGLRHTTGSAASMLLNLEGPFTVSLACLLFGEQYGRRLVLGFVLILGGGVLLSISGDGISGGASGGWLYIAAACACWAFDNNLSKKVGSLDARAFAALKGLIAGIANLLIATTAGQALPNPAEAARGMFVGFLGYGLSLVFFIHALREVGAARTSAYFSTAPFVGSVLSLILLHEPVTWRLITAGVLMAIGVYLHLTEQHGHEPVHEEIEQEIRISSR